MYVRFDDLRVDLKKISTNTFTNFYFWVSIHESETSIRIQLKKDRSPTIRRREFPLIQGWVCSVHKGQGLTLEEVVISFDFLKQKYSIMAICM